jgi:hypothetical protein
MSDIKTSDDTPGSRARRLRSFWQGLPAGVSAFAPRRVVAAG